VVFIPILDNDDVKLGSPWAKFKLAVQSKEPSILLVGTPWFNMFQGIFYTAVATMREN